MKKFIYSIFAFFAISCTFVACSSDDSDPSYDHSVNAATASASTYSGTWLRWQDGTEKESAPGTITLTAGSNANATNMTFSCAEFELNMSSPANIAWANDGYVFNQNVTNNNDANELGSIFAGRIVNGKISTSFSRTTKVGRKTTTYFYSFEGSK
jgi:hypothetical protein